MVDGGTNTDVLEVQLAITAFNRVKMFWGALEVEHGTDPYQPAETKALGESAVQGSGIGVRRVQLVFTRLPPGTFNEDVAVMHFDFMNYTSGNPDDTWIAADYAALETILNTWWTTVRAYCANNVTLKEYRWYRVGSGIVAPNPAARITANGVAGQVTTAMLPPQCSLSLSFHTAIRRSWGRTYLPGICTVSMTDNGMFSTAEVDLLAAALNTLVTSSAAADFQLVVISKALNAALAVEQVAIDNVVDVIRRRRWEHSTYKKTYP
jgi:hypothetical protein